MVFGHQEHVLRTVVPAALKEAKYLCRSSKGACPGDGSRMPSRLRLSLCWSGLAGALRPGPDGAHLGPQLSVAGPEVAETKIGTNTRNLMGTTCTLPSPGAEVGSQL